MTTDCIDVLDHGFVRLVDHMGSDLSVSRAARVSHEAAWRAGQDEGSDRKLIKYLWDHQHSTPFEAVEFQFEVKAPIFILRQWHRHRTWSYNEISARYRPLPEEFYVPDPALIGKQSKSTKQARDLTDSAPDHATSAVIRAACAAAFESYRWLLNHGAPREVARSVLPVSTYSHMFAKVNLRNLLHFLALRKDPHAQYEMRVYADAMEKLIEPIVPAVMAAWRGDQPAAAAA